MKKRSVFKYLHEYQEVKNDLVKDVNVEDRMVGFLTAEDLRTLRDPDSAESAQILESLKTSIH